MEPNIEQPIQNSGSVTPTVDYSKLNLSPGEYVVRAIGRHPIGKLGIWAVLSLFAVMVLGGLLVYKMRYNSLEMSVGHMPSVGVLASVAGLLLALFACIAWVSSVVYDGNKIFLTNESLIQHVQNSLFSTKNEQLNLVKIEDVTVIQNGIIPKMFNYGTIEINTMDSNDAHTLTLVSNPQEAANAIHNAAEQAISRNPEANHASTGPATA